MSHDFDIYEPEDTRKRKKIDWLFVVETTVVIGILVMLVIIFTTEIVGSPFHVT